MRDLGYRLVLVSVMSLVIILWVTVVVMSSPSGLGLLMSMQMTIWGILSQQWIRYERDRIMSAKTDRIAFHRHFALGESTILIFSLCGSYLISPLNSTLAFLAIVNTLCYLSYASMGGLPSNRMTYWLCVLFLVLLTGYLLTLYSIGNALSSLSVEIAGAFLGLSAALALGELLKEVNRNRDNRSLEFLLLEELENVEDYLERGEDYAIPIPVWLSAMADGRILDLPTVLHQKLTRAYRDIELFNVHRLPEYRKQAIESIKNIVD